MKIAIVPGSFDPMTAGHVNVVERVATMFDEVVVAVMNNENKQYMLAIEQRTEAARLSCAHISNVRVICDSGMLVDLVDAVGACAIVKGIRNEKDFAYEQKMAQYNREKNPRAETLYLPSEPGLELISSTAVRERLADGQPVGDLVCDAVASKLVEWGMARPEK